MTFYPIIIPTLNRFLHFKECIESLGSCTHADKTELIIGLDYPPSEKYVDGWRQIKDYIPSIKKFAKVTLFEHKKNLGATGNSVFLRNYASEHYDAYIFTEDDNIFSPCFLDYMDKCLEKYKDDEDIMAICSFINKDEFYENQNNNTVVRISGAFNAWGLGRWSSKQKLYEKIIIPDYREKICNNRTQVIKAFTRPEQFNNFMEWLNNPALNCPCDITYAMANLVLDKYVIYPTKYISKNMGLDGSGVNCSKDENNTCSQRTIINDTEYTIIDNFSKQLDKLNQRTFNRSQNGRLSVKKRFFVRISIISYYLFGYACTNRLRALIYRLKSNLKSIGRKA